jgi:hypothetical protein
VIAFDRRRSPWRYRNGDARKLLTPLHLGRVFPVRSSKFDLLGVPFIGQSKTARELLWGALVSTTQAIIFGMMLSWTPCVVVLAMLLWNDHPIEPGD